MQGAWEILGLHALHSRQSSAQSRDERLQVLRFCCAFDLGEAGIQSGDDQ